MGANVRWLATEGSGHAYNVSPLLDVRAMYLATSHLRLRCFYLCGVSVVFALAVA